MSETEMPPVESPPEIPPQAPSHDPEDWQSHPGGGFQGLKELFEHRMAMLRAELNLPPLTKEPEPSAEVP